MLTMFILGSNYQTISNNPKVVEIINGVFLDHCMNYQLVAGVKNKITRWNIDVVAKDENSNI